MKVVEVRGFRAQCEAMGVRREVSLSMLTDRVEVGDHVLVHIGYAVQKIDSAEAEEIWTFFEEMLATEASLETTNS